MFVDDQDRARDFYTATLGMEINVDAAYGDSARWLTSVSPQDRDGTALLLANNAEYRDLPRPRTPARWHVTTPDDTAKSVGRTGP